MERGNIWERGNQSLKGETISHFTSNHLKEYIILSVCNISVIFLTLIQFIIWLNNDIKIITWVRVWRTKNSRISGTFWYFWKREPNRKGEPNFERRNQKIVAHYGVTLIHSLLAWVYMRLQGQRKENICLVIEYQLLICF